MKRILTYLFLFLWVMVISAQNMDVEQCEKISTQEFGLVLSGGGALGFAHIGAIKALEEAGIDPTWVAGSSMGAIIGVMYTAGYSADEIMQVVKEERLYRVGRLLRLKSALRNSGMSTQKTLLSELHEFVPHNSFDSLKRHFMVCVTDVERGEPVYRYEGANLAEYVAASASIPALFEPVTIDSVRYVDGGVTDNLPASKLLSLNSKLFIIAVDVLPFIENYEAKNAIDMARWTLRLFQQKNMDANRNACDVLVQSFALEKYHEFDFKHYKEIYQYGYDAMKERLQMMDNR